MPLRGHLRKHHANFTSLTRPFMKSPMQRRQLLIAQFYKQSKLLLLLLLLLAHTVRTYFIMAFSGDTFKTLPYS